MSVSNIVQATNTKCCAFFKVPRIGLVEVGRLGQWLNVPTQGRRVAQMISH